MSSGSRHSSYSRCCCITIEVGVLLSLVLLIVLSLYLLYDSVISILDKFVPPLAETLKNWRLAFFSIMLAPLFIYTAVALNIVTSCRDRDT